MWREDSVKMMNSYYEMCRHLINKKDYDGLKVFFNLPIRFTEDGDGDVYMGYDDDMRNMINKILSVGGININKFILMNGLINNMCFSSFDLLFICFDNKEYLTLMIMALCKNTNHSRLIQINEDIENIATDALYDSALDFQIMVHFINLGLLLLNENYGEPPIKYMHYHNMICL